MSDLKASLKKSLPYYWYRRFYRDAADVRAALAQWGGEGYPLPAPDHYKRKLIKDYANRYQIKTFVETGTFLGGTVDAVKDIFPTIYSIEVEPTLYNNASARFEAYPHITILQGDSAVLIEDLLKKIKEPALFWLDAHYSAGSTGKGKDDSSLRDEILLVQKYLKKYPHVLLLDDARDFWGTNGYPSVAEVMDIVYKQFPGYTVEMKHGIIAVIKA